MITDKFQVEITYGSEYQQELYSSMLVMFFEVMQTKMKQSHKGNSFELKPVQ